MTRQACRAMAALAGTLLLAACAGAATGPAPAPDGFTVALGIDPPKLVRFISTAPATRGKACYGRVVDAVDGVPRRVRLLPKEAGFDPCAGIPATPELAMRHLRDALERRKVERGPVETIAEAELATRLLPPVELRPAWLNADEVFVVGAGLNYASHQAETGIDQFVLFPKPVVPTPAYGTLAFPAVANAPPICLLDHEVEIAFVALEDIDLHQDLTPASLWPRLAFLAVDDLTERTPQILDSKRGYTRAKSRPGFLPSGPWLVDGRDLAPTTAEPAEPLRLLLTVNDETRPRQNATSDAMLVGPSETLCRLGTLAPEGPACRTEGALLGTMPDFERERSMVEGHVLPAGSIVLTGTPDGVALKPPTTIAQKVSLVLRGLLRGRKPSAQFVAEQTRDRASLGYLKPGDRVDQWIQHLGRQRWAVGEPAADTVCRG